ncbi:MAG TPA: glycosyltransferase [Candidatus Paceibacterota bacterium]|nr:glycosyltransferase [Candidatus Paceibacterota bacterium]
MSIMIEGLYNALRKADYAVDYIDSCENPKGPGPYDLFVGNLTRWMDIASQSEATVKIIFMETSHPVNRNERMKALRARWNVPRDEELLDTSYTALRAFELADYVIQVGNGVNMDALVANGVPRDKIIPLHYGLPLAWNKHDILARGALNRYVHTAAEMGLRKGLQELIGAFGSPTFKNMYLTLIGNVRKKENYAFWNSRLETLKKENPGVVHLGFIDASSRRYSEILAEHAWYLFPSAEEGEPGTVLEAMTLGLVPILTRDSGIDFALDGNFEATFKESLDKTLAISKEQWSILSEKARHYIILFHDHALFENRLAELFGKIAGGARDLRPTASIILTVHDKEKHIVRLLQTLLTNTRSYPHWDLHIIYDGCSDASRQVAQETLKDFPVTVYEYETPDVWEVKANNYGLKRAQGKYCVILQDDNFIYEEGWLEKMLSWLEEHPKVGILGGLAGVNFFHLDSSDPKGPGVNRSAFELHQRLDPAVQIELRDFIFEVDAVMRGPIILRKALLEKHGYFDETYAPLYNDDMDYCFRMRSLGYGVFCYPINVVNESLTVAQYKNPVKDKFWKDTAEKNQKLLYRRWSGDIEKYHAIQIKVPKPTLAAVGAFRKQHTARLPRLNMYDIRVRSRAAARAMFLRLPASLVRGLIQTLRYAGGRGIAEKLRVHYFEGKTIPWRLANGDANLRVEYPLASSSLIYSIGEKNAQWAEVMRRRYGCMVRTLASWPAVTDVGKDLEARIRGQGDIDLLSLYMDGGEYELLEMLLDSGTVQSIRNIQIKFDDSAPDAISRVRAIRKRLRETHAPTYQYDFVWENWERKK